MLTLKLLKRQTDILLRAKGWELTRYPGKNAAYRRNLIFRWKAVDLVLDVGANEGQYVREIRDYGYGRDVLSFEPLVDAFDVLRARAERDPRWWVSNCAVGSNSSTLLLNVSGNSVSTSALPMLSRHATAAPQSVVVGQVRVPVGRLDDLLPADTDCRSKLYIKVDTQGYEGHVLDGAESTFLRTVALEVELSLTSLYEGQPLMQELIDRLARAGFRLVNLFPGFYDPETGEGLQMDGIFVRESTPRHS